MSQCSNRSLRRYRRDQNAMQSPAAYTPGTDVRSCSSTATPLSSTTPEPSSQPTSGRTPTAVTISSAASQPPPASARPPGPIDSPGQGAGRGPGGQPQPVEAVPPAIGTQYASAQVTGLEAGRGLAEPQLRSERVQVVPQRGVGQLAGHQPLGERRPVVRRPLLCADEGHRAPIPAGPALLL